MGFLIHILLKKKTIKTRPEFEKMYHSYGNQFTFYKTNLFNLQETFCFKRNFKLLYVTNSINL